MDVSQPWVPVKRLAAIVQADNYLPLIREPVSSRRHPTAQHLMYRDPPLTDEPVPHQQRIPTFMRTQSVVRVRLACVDNVTAAHGLRESGGLRLRFPRTTGVCEGILLNTAGGIAGGDHQMLHFTLAERAHATITSQAAEKVYRADSTAAEIDTSLALGSDAKLAWLPQETILFNGAKFLRTLDVDMAASAVLTLKEAVVFGRTARGERLASGQFHDRWRIRRDSRLILAEDVRLQGAIADQLGRPALGNGACAISTIVHAALDAERHLVSLRDALDTISSDASACDAGVSAWNGMLVVRIAGASPEAVRAATGVALTQLVPGATSRIWSC